MRMRGTVVGTNLASNQAHTIDDGLSWLKDDEASDFFKREDPRCVCTVCIFNKQRN
jgi:hypothetical protein